MFIILQSGHSYQINSVNILADRALSLGEIFEYERGVRKTVRYRLLSCTVGSTFVNIVIMREISMLRACACYDLRVITLVARFRFLFSIIARSLLTHEQLNESLCLLNIVSEVRLGICVDRGIELFRYYQQQLWKWSGLIVLKYDYGADYLFFWFETQGGVSFGNISNIVELWICGRIDLD